MKEINVKLSQNQIDEEINKICLFIQEKVKQDKAVIAVSGGLDSDVIARLTVKAIGKSRIKLFIVIQKDLEDSHLQNARELALDLGIDLHEIHLEEFPLDLIRSIEKADSSENFNSEGLLDPSRAKCSIRTAILSTYQDRGYIVIGTSNRTEYETGFFLPFGDGIAHIKPIIHLYKTQVVQIAKQISTNIKVIEQPASAGFWKGQTDLEDLSYWIFNEGPIRNQRSFTESETQSVVKIKQLINTESIDTALFAFNNDLDDFDVSKYSNLPVEIITKLRKLTIEAKNFKHRKLNEQLDY